MVLIFGNGQDGTATISVNTDLGTANLKQYVSLTINAGITLSGNSGMAIYIQKTLTLNGIISVNTVNAAGGGVFIFARVTTGSGTITANGSTGGSGQAPTIEGVTAPSGAGNGTSQSTTTVAAGGLYSVDEIARRIRALISLGQISRYRVNGGAGGSGGAALGVCNGCPGSSGGAGGSIFDSGGSGGGGGAAGATGNSGSTGAGGSGGGSGGIIVIATFSIISIIFESKGANGGVGGNASGTANNGGSGGGGGGSGGLIAVISPRFSGTVTLTAGTGGAGGTASGTGGSGSAGSDGNAGRLFMWDIRGVS